MTAEEIKEIREALGISQEEFADLLGVQFSTVNRWENNKSKPQGQNEQILTLLKIIIDEAKDKKSELSIDDIKKLMKDFKSGKALGMLSGFLPTGLAGALLFGGIAGFIGGLIANYLLKKLDKED